MAGEEHHKHVRQNFGFKNVQLFKNETLGTGSYGAVCKAKYDQLICAAKLLFQIISQIQPPDPGKEHRRPFRRFEEECRFLSRINHPNIVQYLGTYLDPETNALVLLMELMDESLTHFLESSPEDIPYHIQVNISQDIVQALAFLHANGIIHRDLSSNNVLLIAHTRAKITDFGMSRLIDKMHLGTMTLCPGTVVYMSPEALNEPPMYTEKLDIFSFGVLLVQVITKLFPKPSNQFENRKLPKSRYSRQMIEARVPVPEVQRRQAHISLIDPTHPLLPTALECLKDEAVERPSSQQLCQSLDALKLTKEYEKSTQHDVGQLLHAAKQQLRASDEQIEIKESVVRNNTQRLKVLQTELEVKEHQLGICNRNLEEAKARLEQTISERDKEISDLRKQVTREKDEPMSASAAEEPLCIVWDKLDEIQTEFASSAVVGNTVYFKSKRELWEFNFITRKMQYITKHPYYGFTLVNIEDELTTVGGYVQTLGKLETKNELYNCIEEKLVKKYPPMPTNRWACTAVYTHHVLIVAGGSNGSKSSLDTVEILNTSYNQWFSINSLPFPTSWPSISICRDYIYLHAGDTPSENDYHSVVRCHLSAITVPTQSMDTWKPVACLPVIKSTLATMNGSLLALGGTSHRNEDTRDVHQYNTTTDRWQRICQMSIARSQCTTALFPDNKLIVVGGSSSKHYTSEMAYLVHHLSR